MAVFTPTATPTPTQAVSGMEPFIWLPLALVALIFLLISLRRRANRK